MRGVRVALAALSPEILKYILIGAALVALEYIYLTVKNRRVARALVPQVRKMRMLASQTVTYRAPQSDEPISPDTQPLFEAVQGEIRAAGLSVLGDLIEVHPSATAFSITRWFMDESQTVCGWFGVVRNKETGKLTQVMMLFSESASGDFFVTGRGTTSTALAQPPMTHRTFCEWNDGLVATIGRHRGMLAEARATAVRQARDLDAGPALVTRLRDSAARWRATQPQRALLEQDVRALVGNKWRYVGRTVVRLMSEEVTDS